MKILNRLIFGEEWKNPNSRSSKKDKVKTLIRKQKEQLMSCRERRIKKLEELGKMIDRMTRKEAVRIYKMYF